MNQVPYMPVTRKPRVMQETTSPRSLRIRSGMIGFSIRDSSVRNPASSATAMARPPIVLAEPQPSAVASTIA